MYIEKCRISHHDQIWTLHSQISYFRCMKNAQKSVSQWTIVFKKNTAEIAWYHPRCIIKTLLTCIIMHTSKTYNGTQTHTFEKTCAIKYKYTHIYIFTFTWKNLNFFSFEIWKKIAYSKLINQSKSMILYLSYKYCILYF